MDFDNCKDSYVDKIDIKAALTGSFPDDTPLLEEIGINFSTIKKESYLVFNIFKMEQVNFSIIKNADISGPIIFLSLYAISLMINCKIHFGYVYFISLVCLFSTFFLLNVIDVVNIRLLECCSVLGYSFIPLVMFSILNLCLGRLDVFYRIFCGLIFAGWSSYTASLVFVRYLDLTNKQLVIWYPLMIAYVCFSMIVIF